MKPHHQGTSRRRGPRRPPRRGRRGPQSAPKPQPRTFWQKIVELFTGPVRPAKPKAAIRPQSRPVNGSRAQSGRKPELVEVTSPKLYVGNLSFDATESDLFDLFNGVGRVQSAEVVSHRQTQRSKGFAFVQMSDIAEARRAVDELHDKEFMGRKLVVSGAKASDSARTSDG